MNSESRDKELGKKKTAEGFERVDELMQESERVGLFDKLERVAERLREGPYRKLIDTLERVRSSRERRAEGIGGVVDMRSGGSGGVPPATTPSPTPPGEISPTPDNIYITKWDLLSTKSRVIALFYLDQVRWRYQYALIQGQYLLGARYWKKKKKKKKESDYTELFMIDDLFGDKDVDLSKVIGSMV